MNKNKNCRDDYIDNWFIGYFDTIIDHILEDKEIKLFDIEIISVKEKRQILYDFNNTQTDYPRDKTIHELFEEQAERNPDSIAAVGMAHGPQPPLQYLLVQVFLLLRERRAPYVMLRLQSHHFRSA